MRDALVLNGARAFQPRFSTYLRDCSGYRQGFEFATVPGENRRDGMRTLRIAFHVAWTWRQNAEILENRWYPLRHNAT
jgi:hypothetical protein